MILRHRSKRLDRASAIAVIWAALLAAPSSVSACSSDLPTFAEAVRGADAIARVTIVEGFDPASVDPTRTETYRPEGTLKGSLDELVTVAPAWTSLCQDSIGYVAGADTSEGRTIIVAFGLVFEGQVIHPMWAETDDGVLFGTTADLPDGVTTMVALETAILRAIATPDTSTVATGRTSPPPVLFVVAAALLAAGLFVRRPFVRPGDIRDHQSTLVGG